MTRLKFLESNKLLAYFMNNSEFIMPISNALKELTDLFGIMPTLNFEDIPGEGELLYLIISTKESPEAANQKLDTWVQQWWDKQTASKINAPILSLDFIS